MAQNPYQDPSFLRRQREKREAEKRARAAAEEQVSAPLKPLAKPLDPHARQQAIDAYIQELLAKQDPGVD